MESELLPDKEKNIPSVPINSYQWEDLKKAREAGGYPWTHLLKAPLHGEITAEDIIRESTPRRSMSREIIRSRTHSPVDKDVQKILNLDSSPGSSRKHGEEGEDEGVHIPNFSKEISLDSEDDAINQAVNAYMVKRPESQANTYLVTPVAIPKNVSPKGILKRRIPEQQYNIGVTTETREKTKCCHPLVNKIKHLADKTLHKLERNENEKSPISKRKQNEDQEIRLLKSSPGAVRRQKFSAIKLGDSDEMSKTLCVDTPPPKKKKEHIYEDIGEAKGSEKSLQFLNENDEIINMEGEKKNNGYKEHENYFEKKSIASQDPSLILDDISLKNSDHVMERLHKVDNSNKEARILNEEMDTDEPNIEEVFQNQLDERLGNSESPNITITEITEEDAELSSDQPTAIPIESSPSPSPHDTGDRRHNEFPNRRWSKPSSDHEYEIIEKPSMNILYTAPSLDDKSRQVNKTDDELSSTTSLERKYLQHTSDEEEQLDDKEIVGEYKTEDMLNAEALQKNIEDRYFLNTPSTPSRTECEISTSQVDSSALEQLPLKRDSRPKNPDNGDNKLQQRIRESTVKLKSQAGKLKTKLQNIKTKQVTTSEPPKNTTERSKFKLPQRPKITLPDRPKFKLPDRRKFSLPDRPKFNLAEKLNRSKFTLPERPKFNVPEFNVPKFKMPQPPKINFSNLGKKKENKVSDDSTDTNVTAKVEFKTYPRLFNRKKNKDLPKTSSSPTLNREDTPPPTFNFMRIKKYKEEQTFNTDSPEQPREYGNIENDDENFETSDSRRIETTYDFDKLDTDYMDDKNEVSNLQENCNAISTDNVSLSKQEYTHVITEINNDEFFVRPRGISREDIQTREYLNDETRKAFQNPKNILTVMGSMTGENDENMYLNDAEADCELMFNDNERMRYSTEDLNDKDDGYYTFPPVRPSRAKRKKNEEDSTPYIDESITASMQFSEVDLHLPKDHEDEHLNSEIEERINLHVNNHLNFTPNNDLHSIHEYANDDVIQYPENIPIQSQTLPMPPKRKKKIGKRDFKHSSLNDFNNVASEVWEEPQENEPINDIIVYRTEHEYIVPQDYPQSIAETEQSPMPPRRNRSRSSRGTSLCDDDRTSHGAESLTLDINMLPADDADIDRIIRHESPGYATVDKGPYVPSKGARRSKSKTPPRRRKSNSSERKYYTVGPTKPVVPDRPPRKKSSTSLMTLDSFTKRSISGDLTQYVEIDGPIEEVHRDLHSGEIVSKMKDRPLPPPPRPPRGSRRGRKNKSEQQSSPAQAEPAMDTAQNLENDDVQLEDVIEIEVSTQTDPLPDDLDFELGIDENLDISMSSSLRDIIDDDSMIMKSNTKLRGSPHFSRPTSRSEASSKLSNPKISELSKANIGRTSPTVILVERRVSSPTRINERDEMLTEASLTVQHIDIDQVQIPDVPPLPRARKTSSTVQSFKNTTNQSDEKALEKVSDTNRDIQLDNLVTQRLQVKDLDVGRLNVSELQANKILVSDIEGMTLQVSELDTKSGHISVSGIEFSQSVIDEIVKKFAEISTTQSQPPPSQSGANLEVIESQRPISREEQTQTDDLPDQKAEKIQENTSIDKPEVTSEEPLPTSCNPDDMAAPPQRPPPPDLTPLLYSYLQDLTIPPASFYPSRSLRERVFPEHHEPQHQTPPPPTRRAKRKPAAPLSETSSEDGRPRPSPRRMHPPVKTHEPTTIAEAGVQFLRVCHMSISRTVRNIFNSFMSYISGAEDKKDVQMAMVIFLVLIAGLIMLGLSDSRAVHHHHWEFFNPPNGKP